MMGEIAEMMLYGTLCEGCGGAIGDQQSPGYPRYCDDCKREHRIKCEACGKVVSELGTNDHMRGKHGMPKNWTRL